MNTSDNTQNPRPFGYWVKAVDRLMAAEFATAFESEGATRRDWRLLSVVDGTAPADRPLHPGKLRGLVERGWIAQDGKGWTLTDDGRAAKERLSAVVDGIRAQMADAVSPEDFDTTVATLEQIARTFGWDENTPLPRGRRGEHGGRGERHGHGERPHFGRRHGFGPGFRHGVGPDLHHGFGPDLHHGRDRQAEGQDAHGCRHPHAHGEGRAHGRRFDREHHSQSAPEFNHGNAPDHGGHRGFEHPHGRDHRAAQVAFERGFDAGYSRGRDA